MANAEDRDLQRLKDDLFGLDDEEEDNAELDGEGVGDDLDEPAAPAAPAHEIEDDVEDEVPAKRKRTLDDSDDEGAAAGSEHKRQRAEEEALLDDPDLDEQDDEPLERSPPPEGEEPAQDVPQDLEDEDAEVAPTADDDAFIDDTGVEHEEHYGDDEIEEGDGMPPPEAEEGEEDELDAMLKQKHRRRKPEDQGTIEREVYCFLAEMDIAAEHDAEAHRDKKPALNKLKMLRKVEDFLAKVTYHEEFLRQGGLGSLKAWLQYYEDGTLPHLRVRSSILRILDKLPINTMFEEHKQMLAKSMVGQLVMFLMKCRDEVQDNQRMAKSLVEKWSKPIFEASNAERKHVQEGDEQERLEARKMRKQVEQQQQAVKDKEMAKVKAIKRGEKGFRIHAAIPQAAKLDYVRRPESLVQAPQEERTKKETSRFDKKVREISRKKNSAAMKAANVSVQGRGLYM